MAERKINGGRIAITIEGRDTFLEPSLEACVDISAIAGGMHAAIQRCNQLDFRTICEVIGAGLIVNGKRLSPNLRQKELPKSVYESGLFYMSAKAIEFITVVANGGRMVEDDEEEGGEEEGPLSPSENTIESSSSESQAG